MITGSHLVIFTKDPEADRAFFRNVLDFRSVDAGEGWLIFAMPPSEAAFHPGENGRHEIYLTCDDLEATLAELAGHGVSCAEPKDEGWGVLTAIRLPGGGDLGLYQPRHPMAF